MYASALTLLALSASAVLATPHHQIVHKDLHRRDWDGDWKSLGLWRTWNHQSEGQTVDASSVAEKTFTPMAASAFGQAASPTAGSDGTTTCTTTSISTVTSTNIVTVTSTRGSSSSTPAADTTGAAAKESASAQAVSIGSMSVSLSSTKSVSAGAFYGGSYTRGAQSYTPSAVVESHAAFTAVNNPSTTMATVVRSSAAASSSAVNTSPSTGSTGGKRGISFNSASNVAAFGNSVSWAYNWASSESGNLGGVEYVPMAWGLNDVSSIASKVGSAKHVLSFNEPDLSSQSNIDPVTAATKHKAAFSSLKGKLEIGSPAVTNGGGSSPPMGTTWLDQFFTACGSDCPVDFVAFHWYDSATNFAYFKSHTQDVISTAAKYGVNKVWLTEFAPSGSAADQASFMQQAVAFLDSTPQVERYAAFMAADGQLMTGSGLNSVGSAYAASS